MSSKWCCVLAVVCLSVMLLSLDADAQQTVHDDSSQCGSASLWEVMNMVSAIASNQQQIKNEVRDGIGGVRERIASECEKTNETTLVSEIRDVKRLLESGNETRLEDVVKEMKGEMQEMKDVMRESVVEVRKMRDEMKNVSDRVRAEMEEVKRLVLSRSTECECATVKPTENSTYPAVTTSTSPPEHSTVQPSKQQLVSALVCEYSVWLWFHYTDLTRVQLNE